MNEVRLSQVPEGSNFEYEGKVLTHDLVGRSGGGQVAVRTLDGKETFKLRASVMVVVVEDKPAEEEEVVEETPVEFPLDVLPKDEEVRKNVGKKDVDFMEELKKSFFDRDENGDS